nr:uncharacterized protein CTRU02_03171 [Colletotrichum truncatum]KAF6797140.1 hypothetical protein CTRU02_03171 [Colletotrichum truncatum]
MCCSDERVDKPPPIDGHHHATAKMSQSIITTCSSRPLSMQTQTQTQKVQNLQQVATDILWLSVSVGSVIEGLCNNVAPLSGE